MKKFFLIGGGVLLVGAVVFSFVFFSKDVGHRDSLASVDGGVLKLQNAENSDIKIIVADTNNISINLGGVQEEEAKKVRFFKSGKGTTELDLTHKWWGNDAVITVPKGTLIEVTLDENKPIILEDPVGGDKQSDGSKSFLIDTETVNEITFDSDAVSVEGDGTDEVIVWDPDNWDFFEFDDTEGGEGEGEGEDEGGEGGDDDYLPPVCSVGSQAIRNYCCEMLNEEEETPYCSGYGHWIFNNTLRICNYTCEIDDGGDDPDDPDDFFLYVDDPADCLDGSPTMQNACCADQNEGVDTPECIGEWRFDAIEISCSYHCFTSEELEDYYSGQSGGGDESTEYCSSLATQVEQDECCEYHFGNELSTGPNPGLPDCVGKWYFDNTDDDCKFRCADHAEMMEILKEIKENQ